MSKYGAEGGFSPKVRLLAWITRAMVSEMCNRLEPTEAEIATALELVGAPQDDDGVAQVESALYGDEPRVGQKLDPLLACIEGIEEVCDDYLEALGVPSALDD
jgi:hypothetical protein